ncbi:MAG: cysteine rich repeat-containing protein [Methylocystis sp.]
MIISRKMLAVVALGALAMAPAARAGDKEVLTYCMEDVQRLCAGVQPGGGRILKCLKAHKEGMSVGCAQGLMKLKGGR